MPSAPVRLLASTGPLLLSPLGWVLEAIGDAGFDGAEMVMGHSSETRDPDRVRALVAATGVDVPVVHGPYMLLLRHVLGTRYIDKSRRALELASEMGASVMVAHAPFRFEVAACRWLAGEAIDEMAEHSARFGMENLFPVAGRNISAAVTPEDLLGYKHVVFDTSHFAVAGVNIFRAWNLLRDRVVHLHLSDNLGLGRDSHAPLGTGRLPLEAFLAHVVRSGWTGTATLEVDVRPYLGDRTTLVRFLADQRRLAAGMLAAGEPSATAGVTS